MKFGYFDDARREYVITTPRTPVKWISYVGTLAFGGFVDNTGGALICKGDPALNRITKYIPQLPNSEFKGTTLYLRFREDGSFRMFSPTFVPTLDPYDLYECHVGLGYTRIVSEFYGLRTKATLFVPRGGSCLIQDIQVTNVSDQEREVDAIPVVEYTHPDALKQFTNADWVPQTMRSQAQRNTDGTVILLQYAFMNKDSRVNYFTSNLPASSLETDRRHFLGANETGTWVNPLSVQQEELGDHEARRGDNVAALLHHLGRLEPGGSARLITQLGQTPALTEALPHIHRYRDPAEVEKAFDELAAFWDDYLSRLQVETPDEATNCLLNIHNPRQCHTTKNWSRYLSLYQLGFGARGIGFRDSSQDVLGILAHIPQEARSLIRQLLHVQKRDGSAMHQFNPMTMVANEGDSREAEDAPRYYSDDHLWIVLTTAAYLKETGDLKFLQEVIPYYEKRRNGQPVEQGTELDHLRRAVDFTSGNLGKHGLPLLGFADWNDTVNLPAGAESLFAANLYGAALRELITLLLHLNDVEGAVHYERCYATMCERVNEQAWDDQWYVRYFAADGSPIGSHSNSAGQIYCNGQSWPVISGFAPRERGRMALDAVYERLNTSKGIKLSTPGYDRYDPAKGGVTTFPAGAKENGGIFLHANPWVIIAECLLGNGNRAYEYYAQINPTAKNDLLDEFECEPYVFPQNILGDEHPQFGLARNSWLTGTASWAYVAATQYILGLRPGYAGLRVAPCIPSEWHRFRVIREFRSARYEIEVHNPEGVCTGVASLVVDGQEISGDIVPVHGDGRTHQVQVVMGPV
ncbi:MAG TPA: glycosyl transferase [Anaerolineae bacterium]|nr:glycosyl transferase [Anaerolineae bacterium]